MKKMDNIYYIYVYLDPRKKGCFIYNDLKFEYEPFYIGKGKDDRITEGIKDKRQNEYKKAKINKIKEENLDVIYFKLFENLLEDDSYEIEKELIKKIGRKRDGGPLTNIHIGGKGGDMYTNNPNKEEMVLKWHETINRNKLNGKIYWKRTEEWNEKIKEYHKLKKELGIPYHKLSQESKDKISIAHKGKKKPRTEEHNKKLGMSHKGLVRSEESKLQQSITCKETLSKMRDKLSENAKGDRNPNAKKYILEINSGEIIEIIGYKNVLLFYNKFANVDFKDHYYVISKLKDNKIENIKLIDIVNIN